MAAKVAYELKANVTRVEIALPDGKALILHGDKDRYETSDPFEIAELENAPGVKRAEKAAK